LLIRRWATNARMITRRIGNAALLKNRLKDFLRTVNRGNSLPNASESAYQAGAAVPMGDTPRSCPFSHPFDRTLPGVPRHLQCRDVVEVAVALFVVEAVADREPVGDLESDVLGRQVDAPPLRLRQQRADLE